MLFYSSYYGEKIKRRDGSSAWGPPVPAACSLQLSQLESGLYSHAEVKMPSAPVTRDEAAIRSDYEETAPNRRTDWPQSIFNHLSEEFLGWTDESAQQARMRIRAFHPAYFFFRCPQSCHCPTKSNNGHITGAWLVRRGLGTDRPQHETFQRTSLAGILQNGIGQEKRLDNSSFFFFKWTKLPKKPRLACVRGCERSWNLLISPGLQGEEERLSAKEGHSVQWPCYTWLSGEGPRRGPSASTLIPQSPHRPESWLLPEKNDREAEPGLSQQPGTGALCWGRRGKRLCLLWFFHCSSVQPGGYSSRDARTLTWRH